MGLLTRTVKVVDNEATGSLMRTARIKTGLSLREMARRLKQSPPYVSDLELGRRKWTQAKVDKWAEILLKA